MVCLWAFPADYRWWEGLLDQEVEEDHWDCAYQWYMFSWVSKRQEELIERVCSGQIKNRMQHSQVIGEVRSIYELYSFQTLSIAEGPCYHLKNHGTQHIGRRRTRWSIKWSRPRSAKRRGSCRPLIIGHKRQRSREFFRAHLHIWHRAIRSSRIRMGNLDVKELVIF